MIVKNFLDKRGFPRHPFGTWIAEDEGELREWFVPPPFLQTVIGERRRSSGYRPSSSLIFGNPGSGKTALRRTLEEMLLEGSRDALVLRYVDFAHPLVQGHRPGAPAHVEELLLLGTIGLLAAWTQDPSRYERLGPAQKMELAGLVKHYYESLPPEQLRTYSRDLSPVGSKILALSRVGVRAAVDVYNATISIMKREKIEPADWTPGDPRTLGSPYLRLERFWSLASSMGVRTVWVLVDGVDEAPGVNTGQRIFECVADILLDQRIIEFRRDEEQVLCFKVFLTRPSEVLPLLVEARFRTDRIKTKTIQWSRADLDQALRKRLAFFSGNTVIEFDSLCDASAKGAHDRLLDACELVPRTLFRMCHEVINQLELRNDESVDLIDRAMLDAGIQAGRASVVE